MTLIWNTEVQPEIDFMFQLHVCLYTYALDIRHWNHLSCYIALDRCSSYTHIKGSLQPLQLVHIHFVVHLHYPEASRISCATNSASSHIDRPAASWCSSLLFDMYHFFPSLLTKNETYGSWSKLVILKFPNIFKIANLGVTTNVRLLRRASVFNICLNALNVSCFIWWDTIGNGLGCLVDISPFLSLWHCNNTICFLDDHDTTTHSLLSFFAAWHDMVFVTLALYERYHLFTDL